MLSQDDAGGGGNANGSDNRDSRFSQSQQLGFQHHQQYEYNYDSSHQQQQQQQFQYAPRSMWQQQSNSAASSAWVDVISASSSHLRGGPATLDATTENTVSAPPTATSTSSNTTTTTPGTSNSTKKKSAKKAAAKKDVFICSEVHCGKQFPRSFALRRHQRIHTGNKPYACDELGCTQRFNTSGNLSRHKRIHSGERPYPCIFATCGKKFNTSTKLKRHMRIHFPEGQNLFRCLSVQCAWSSDNYKEFAQHQKVHHGIIVGAGLQSQNQSQYKHPVGTSATLKNDADFFLQAAPDQQQTHHHHSRPDFELLTPSSSHHQHQQQASSSSTSNSSFLFNSFIGDKGKQATPSTGGPRKLMNQFFSIGGSDLSVPVMPKEPKKLMADDDHGYADSRRGKSAIAGRSVFPLSDHDAGVPQYHHSRSSSYETSTFALNSESSYQRNTSSFGTHFPHLRSETSSDGNEDYDHHSTSRSQQFQHQHPSSNSSNHNSLSGGHHSHLNHHLAPAHHVLRPPQGDDAMKFGGFAVPPSINPAASEFTGEELSVVLELMKDPYC